jgi:3-hydroxybutyryl-CoA dehydrogenase
MKKIMVLGSGTMGSGIVQSLILNGYDVYMYARSEAKCERERGVITANLDRMLAKNKLTQAAYDDAIARIIPITTYEAAADAELVIETIIEDLAIKCQEFAKLDQIINKIGIFTSNTSSISVTALAGATTRPDKFCGMHFFIPPALSPVIEIARAIQTSDETFAAVRDLTLAIGKKPIEVKESPAFVFNRITIPMINEAAFLLYEGVASADDIDATLKLASSLVIGPLALADLVGLDVCEMIMNALYTEFQDPKYRMSPLNKKLARAGHLGRKTGKGFFTYEK